MEITVRLLEAKANLDLAKNVCTYITQLSILDAPLIVEFHLQDGSTPLCEASLSGSASIVNTLLSAGATVDQEDEVESKKCMHSQGSLFMAGITKTWFITAYSSSMYILKASAQSLAYF